MAILKYPYTNLHELNLDWLIEQLNNPDGPVRSVNGKSGIVTLTGEDIARSTSNPETVAAALQTQGSALQTVRNQIGVTALPTVAQTLTGAIAENAQTIADVEDNVIGNTELPTEAQTLTGAIAENADNIGGNANSITGINNKIGTTAMPTTAQTLTGAIAENAGNISNLNTQKASYEAGTWTPHLYDLDTKIRDLPAGNYFKIGKVVVATIYVDNVDLSDISTMMQIRNVPMDFVAGGSFYMAGLTNGQGANNTIQGTTARVYFRPNITSSAITTPTGAGVFSLVVIGFMN